LQKAERLENGHAGIISQRSEF